MKRAPILRLHADEMVIDNFAGGGGASTGIEWALGRSPDIAVNHDAQALALHEANHPATKHLCEDVFDVQPREVCKGRKVALAWFSPDCTFFSKARGKKPHRDRNKARRRRGLANVALKWAAQVRPRVIVVENVEEFEQWAPLGKDGLPDPKRLGFSFRRWRARLENMGYAVELRQLRGHEYGALTTRKRLFIIARCDGLPIVWPQPTHGPGLLPFRTAAECIDWSIPVKSIFGRKKPLAEATLRRIARGLKRYVFDAAQPFIAPYHSATSAGSHRVQPIDEPLPTQDTSNRFGLVVPYIARTAHGEQDKNGKKRGRGEHSLRDPLPTQPCSNDFALIAPTLINTRNGERHGRHGEQAPRIIDIQRPYPTVTAVGSQGALVAAFLARHYGGHENDGAPMQLSMPTITARDHHAVVTSNLVQLRGTAKDGKPVTEPMPTVTAGGNHIAEVRAFLIKYYGTDQDPQLGLPLHTITTKDRFGLVTVSIGGHEYAIVDIGMRMLAPHELFRAQGFGPDYKTTCQFKGKPLTQEARVRLVGNSVCPPVAEALVRAQFAQQARRAEAAG